MGTSQSKFRPIFHSCYELGHTWCPSCTDSGVEVAFNAFEESLKIYSSVYLVSSRLKWKIPDAKQLKSLVLNILQSSLFLAYNAFGYLVTVCGFRKLFGFYNYYTFGWFNSFVCSFLALLIERPSRRAMLAIYTANVATESLLNSYLSAGTLPSVSYGETFLFSGLTAILMRLYRTGGSNRQQQTILRIEGDAKKEEDEMRKDIVFSFIRQLIGNDEASVAKANIASESFSVSRYSWRIVAAHFYRRIKYSISNMAAAESKICPHQGTNCLTYAAKGFLRPFLAGTGIQLALLLTSVAQGKSFRNLQLFSSKTFGLGIFLGLFGGVFKFSSCLFRGLIGCDHPNVAIPAGALAGLSMSFYRSKSLAIYVLWKTAEIVCRELHCSGVMPAFPLAVELLYAFSTAILFHLGVNEPQSLKPSYRTFMDRITGQRFREVNRVLLDHEYGTEASLTNRHLPKFQPEYISEEIKQLFPQTLLH